MDAPDPFYKIQFRIFLTNLELFAIYPAYVFFNHFHCSFFVFESKNYSIKSNLWMSQTEHARFEKFHSKHPVNQATVAKYDEHERTERFE